MTKRYMTSHILLVLAVIALGSTFLSCGSDEDPGAPAVITDLSVSPSSFDYGEVCEGDSKDKTVTLKAGSSNTEHVSGTVSVTGAGFALISGNGDYDLAPGKEMQVTIRFTASSSAGKKTCIVEAGGTSVTGEVLSRNDCESCVVSATSLFLGNICVGTTAEDEFTITAPSTNTKSVSGSVTNSCGEFSLVSGGGSYTLNPGQTRTVRVRYSPVSTGTQNCVIQTGTKCPDVSARGMGISSLGGLSTTSVNVGGLCADDTRDGSFTIRNSILNFCAISGNVTESCTSVGIISGGGSYTLQPGQEKTVTVRVAPFGTPPGNGECWVETGLPGPGGDRRVKISWFVYEYPYLEWRPFAANNIEWRSNYFKLADLALFFEHAGLYGNPTWDNCTSGNGFILDASPAWEAGVILDIKRIPAGTSQVIASITGDAETDRVRLLLEVDGSEVIISASTNCRRLSTLKAVGSGTHRIKIGTNENLSGVGSDGNFFISANAWVRYEFRNACLVPVAPPTAAPVVNVFTLTGDRITRHGARAEDD